MNSPGYRPLQLQAAVHAPVAPYTWEVQQLLPRATLETARIPLRWNRPVHIVGMYPSVIAGSNEGGGLRVPTTDDIQVLIGANQQDRFTNRLEQAAGAGLAESYVTLASVGTQLPRLVEIMLTNDAPQVDVTFRWKIDTTASPWWEDAYCSLAFFCVYL